MIKGELLEEIIVDMGLVDDLLDEVNAIFHEKKLVKLPKKDASTVFCHII